jgi:antitoxin VapB
MLTERHARLFRSGDSQAVQIPHEFELPGDEVIVRKQGDRLVIEPVKMKSRLPELLASWEPIDDDFPGVDEGLYHKL